MVESTQTIQAAEAIRSLFAAGVDEREIHELVNAVATETRSNHDQDTKEDDLQVYDVLPQGLISLRKAADKYGYRVRTLYTWHYRGHVKAVARERAPASGGGYLAVKESELVAFMKAPRNKGGRPRKRYTPPHSMQPE